MIFAVLYPWLEALHVAAALLFVAGVVGTCVFLNAAAANRSMSPSAVAVVRRWDRKVTTPAMLFVWMFGFAMAWSGYGSGSFWLPVKVVFVVFLSALHGLQSGRLRRLEGAPPALRAWQAPAMVVSVIVIAMLAVLKPF